MDQYLWRREYNSMALGIAEWNLELIKLVAFFVS